MSEEETPPPPKPSTPTPIPQRRRRESAIQSDLDYVLMRQKELRDRAAREARYRPGFKVDPPKPKQGDST